MDELKKSLETYRLQLHQIEFAISNGQNDPELVSLQQEMKELISLTEESLLAYEKSSLLSTFSENCDNVSENSCQSNAPVENKSQNVDLLMASFYADINSTEESIAVNSSNFDEKVVANETADSSDAESDQSDESIVGNEEFLKTIEDRDDITGVKCQAPYETEWSGRQYHNAMIMSVDTDEETTEASVFVKVLFLNPTLEEMKPCTYFLDGSCRFGEEDCKFSHGFRVSLYHLRQFREPDFSSFSVKSHCLAKHPSGIWHPASLVRSLDNHQYEVKFLHKNLTATLAIDDVVPTSRDNNTSESESESDDDDDVVVVINDSQSKTSDTLSEEKSLGKWEQYTNGFGSKMLMKFGYKMGEGLGKDKKGRVEPVPVIVLPPGKSLDHCMRIKEKKLGVVDNSAQPGHSHRKRLRRTVFNFLNRTLGDKKKDGDYLRKLLPKDSFGIKKEKPKTGACKIKVELMKNESKIKQLKEKVQRYKDSIERNRIRDPTVAKKQQIKLNETLEELKTIQSTNKAIELHQNRADTHRKMTQF